MPQRPARASVPARPASHPATGSDVTGCGVGAIMESSSARERPPTMTLIIDLPPELEAQLREEAERAGLETDAYVRGLLEERVRHARTSGDGPPQIDRTEADLLQKINQGLPPQLWQRYHELVARRRA